MSTSDVVHLRDGPAVPRAALDILWSLENRGFTIKRAGDVLVVGPRAQLTDDDRAAIAEHRLSLLRLVEWLRL
jgi:hypothetical protein